jgi:SAM-dependent methyltransferase
MGKTRIALARCMIRVGGLLQSLAVTVMRPDDFADFGRQRYNREVDNWSAASTLEEGLFPTERSLLEHCPMRSGRMLLLGVGGGREAIPFAQQGFSVTGVDFVAEMVERARVNAKEHGLEVEGLVQEISRLEVPPSTFDIAWLSSRMYSCIPTRARRVAMLQRVGRALRDGGVCVCQFHWDHRPLHSPRVLRLHRLLARLTFGHWNYEAGDTLWFNREFLHAFSDEESLRAEFNAAGFKTLHLKVLDQGLLGGAVLGKKENAS